MKALRWIAVLPGAIVGVIIARFLLRLVTQATLSSETIQANPEPVERFLVPFVAAAAFVAAGTWIAPSNRALVAVLLGLMLAAVWCLYLFGFFS